MKALRKIFVLILLSLALSAFVAIPKTNAATFDPGRIIDNAVFTNKSSMSVADIQNFLNSKVPVCDTWHTAGPSAQGATPPWTCLKDYRENISTGANNLNGQPIPSGAISAAQIIYDVAQTYSINPQVLLVTLQKENGLITDDWPYPWQYRTAMGFACPDNGSCDPAYYGFYKQVNQAARHFRNFYDLNPSWYIPYRPGTNYIQYNPNASCGGTNVNIANNATAALYSYTPYQPNAAALNNLYGTGDSCSAYGNRNFWRDFNNWFGSTLAPNTNWRFEILDGTIDSVSKRQSNVGPTPTSIVFNGVLYVFYYDVSTGDLRRALSDENGWTFDSLDGSGGLNGRVDSRVGWKPTVINYQNSLHVYYYDLQNGKLRHAWSDSSGNNWQFEILDGAGGANGRVNSNTGQTPTAVVQNSDMFVFYHDVTGGDLRQARWDGVGQVWTFQTLDGTPTSPGKYNANLGYEPFALIYGTSLQLFYYDSTNGNLRHAWKVGSTWYFENLDGDPGSIGRYNSNLGRASFGIVFNNSLQLYYYDAQQGNLRHAWTDSRGWNFENLEGDAGSISGYNADIGMGGSATVYNNSLQLYYYDTTRGNLRHTWTSSSGWNFENLDGDQNSVSMYSSNLGQYSTSTVFNDTIQIYYQDAANGDLRHAWHLP